MRTAVSTLFETSHHRQAETSNPKVAGSSPARANLAKCLLIAVLWREWSCGARRAARGRQQPRLANRRCAVICGGRVAVAGGSGHKRSMVESLWLKKREGPGGTGPPDRRSELRPGARLARQERKEPDAVPRPWSGCLRHGVVVPHASASVLREASVRRLLLEVRCACASEHAMQFVHDATREPSAGGRCGSPL
jgi:hypothetical protein